MTARSARSSSRSREKRPKCRNQRTASVITSGGNRTLRTPTTRSRTVELDDVVSSRQPRRPAVVQQRNKPFVISSRECFFRDESLVWSSPPISVRSTRATVANVSCYEAAPPPKPSWRSWPRATTSKSWSVSPTTPREPPADLQRQPETARQPHHRVIDTETGGPTTRPARPQHTRPPGAVTSTKISNPLEGSN